ncbi:MAG TPA: hypothetical protein VFT57_02270 [Gemmatimonadaceae bacterium]|nr:hypothetical protein [Gemmatimonadaceae bacterium]
MTAPTASASGVAHTRRRAASAERAAAGAPQDGEAVAADHADHRHARERVREREAEVLRQRQFEQVEEAERTA